MGKATILKPGKYAINSLNFVIGPLASFLDFKGFFSDSFGKNFQHFS